MQYHWKEVLLSFSNASLKCLNVHLERHAFHLTRRQISLSRTFGFHCHAIRQTHGSIPLGCTPTVFTARDIWNEKNWFLSAPVCLMHDYSAECSHLRSTKSNIRHNPSFSSLTHFEGVSWRIISEGLSHIGQVGNVSWILERKTTVCSLSRAKAPVSHAQHSTTASLSPCLDNYQQITSMACYTTGDHGHRQSLERRKGRRFSP